MNKQPFDPQALKQDDLVRSLVPASEILYQDGVLHTSLEGTIRLAEAVISGKVKGNVAAARKLLAALKDGSAC